MAWMELGKAAWCTLDVFTDASAAQKLSHSDVEEANVLGYASALCLVGVVPINLFTIRRHRRRHREFYAAVRKARPCTDFAVSLLAASNCEVMGVSVALAQPRLTTGQQIEAGRVLREIRESGLVSKATEDLPQLVLQGLGALAQLQAGESVSRVQWLSLAVGALALLAQAYAALILKAMGITVSSFTLDLVAKKHGRNFSLADMELHQQLETGLAVLATACNVWFLATLSVPPAWRQFAEIGAAVVAVSLLCSFVHGLLLFRAAREVLWHAALHPAKTAAIGFIAALGSPLIYNAMDPVQMPKLVGCFPHVIMQGRALLMAGLGLWAVWKEDFPINEKLCILIFVVNVMFLSAAVIRQTDSDAEEEQYHVLVPDVSVQDLERLDSSRQDLGVTTAPEESSWKDAGYDAKVLKSIGFARAELKDAGFTGQDLAAAGFASSQAMKEAGSSAKELKEAGFTAKDMKEDGFTAKDMKEDGFTAKDMKDADFTAKDMKEADFTAKDTKEADFTAKDMKEAGFTPKDMKEAGFTMKELKDAGFTTLKDLKDAGVTAKELKETGFTLKELEDAGFEVFRVQEKVVLPMGTFLAVQEMTVTEAKEKCAELPECKAFMYSDPKGTAWFVNASGAGRFINGNCRAYHYLLA